uniref:Uncharacterized protein n=1 Tax=Aegilops tauschii subsp. strangulata TaxID=200361 RepID=A0A452XXF5_AEGTS
VNSYARRRDEASKRADGFGRCRKGERGTRKGISPQRTMELAATGAAALRRSLASGYPVVPRERRRRMPARVSCVGRGGRGVGGGFADEAHLRYYEAPPRKAVEAAARDLTKLRAMGLVAGDPAKEKILSVSALPPSSSPVDLLFCSPFMLRIGVIVVFYCE